MSDIARDPIGTGTSAGPRLRSFEGDDVSEMIAALAGLDDEAVDRLARRIFHLGARRSVS